MRRIVRLTHRYLSFFISIQLLLWTVSGIYFAFNKIEEVRGEQYRLENNFSADLSKINFSLDNATNIKIFDRLGEQIIFANVGKNKYLNIDGIEVAKIGPDDSMKIVEQSTTLKPIESIEINKNQIGSEYRGRPLPLYKVLAENDQQEKINAYVNPYSGEIVAIRSDQWRSWDLMWGFHIMDWRERDNIDNILLKVFSILALVSSLTGVVLFFRSKRSQ
ncbi:MAG: hypothetical protein ACJ0F8_00315 [Gammaproteobacteria bacterium]|uniref:PepSY domain-containing protein n=1 Tax=SAR86 cluster bacterium TaxID=2030880 RepID=A0A520MXF4_9GAMM|nr:PepSY domain-containing protein [SAR86 cluster bacterium]RZO25893.1 MAG: hypothetical protein EVA92_04050 [SAR86 cluster bacterium]|tara:strand:+ start:7269 stop:7925 length:657 start_codon:yes stop_codon:yes gene_type:complete